MLSAAKTADEFPVVPGYEILERVGAGGMGIVYRARQLSLQRVVALKCLRDLPGVARAEAIHRAESHLMASLAHPNVVAIFDCGTAAGQRYLVMEYVSGPTLRERLVPDRPWPLSEAVAAVAAVAEALIYIHENGILHLDLKPENVLCDSSGRLKVTDFGLALHQLETTARAERGVSRGSIDYCSPEHRYGLPVGARSDLFSLAVLAYELFTGRQPGRVYRSVREFNRALPAALDGVLARALARDPEARQPGISAFRRELLCAVESRSWVRRNRLLVGALSCLVCLALGWWLRFAVSDAVRWARGGHAPNDPAPAEVRPEPVRTFTGHFATVQCVALSRDGRRALSGGVDKSVRLWDVGSGACIFDFKVFRGDVNSVAFSHDGDTAVAASDDSTVRLLDLRTRVETVRCEGHTGHVRSAALSRDGQYVLSAGEDGTLRVWNATTAQELRRASVSGTLNHAIFSPDERHIFSCGSDGLVRIWDATTLAEVRRFEGHVSEVCRVAVSSDGARLLSCGFDGTMRLWNVASGAPIGTPFDNGGRIAESCSFSPDEKRAVCTEGPNPKDFRTGPDQGIRIWDLESGKLVHRIGGMSGKVLDARMTPDGEYILAVGTDNLVLMWKAPP